MNRILIAALGFALVSAHAQESTVNETPIRGFTIEQTVILSGTPAEVYDAVTGDISPWWDHHFSQKPARFVIEPRPGGGFLEIFNDSGDGILHATVTWAERGKRLSYIGPLGFAGKATQFVVTYDLAPDPSGTKLHLTVNVAGQIPNGVEKGVQSVWNHFLVERLKPYLESAEYKNRKKTAVKNSSFVAPSGERVLRHEVVVPASLAEVWQTMTTSDGWMTFMAPHVRMELKTGGEFTSNYRVGAKLGDPGTIRNQVLNYVPMEMFSIKVGLTDQFPERPRQAGTLFCVFNLKELGPRSVLVTASMLGWGQGEDWDSVYKFFDRGNSYTMEELVRRFEQGPAVWKEQAQ